LPLFLVVDEYAMMTKKERWRVESLGQLNGDDAFPAWQAVCFAEVLVVNQLASHIEVVEVLVNAVQEEEGHLVQRDEAVSVD
jgi:hypothetical protein